MLSDTYLWLCSVINKTVISMTCAVTSRQISVPSQPCDESARDYSDECAKEYGVSTSRAACGRARVRTATCHLTRIANGGKNQSVRRVKARVRANQTNQSATRMKARVRANQSATRVQAQVSDEAREGVRARTSSLTSL